MNKVITLQSMSDGDLAELYQGLKKELEEQNDVHNIDGILEVGESLASAEYEIVRRWLYEQGAALQ